MKTFKQLTCMLQGMALAGMFIMFEIVQSSPLLVSVTARNTDTRGLMSTNLMSLLNEGTEENNFFQDRDKRHIVNHTTEGPSSSLIMKIPIVRRSMQQESPKQPECVAHHEYAVIVPTSQANNTGVLNFESKRGGIRYYYCQKCSTCQRGVRIIRHCTKTNNTLCSPSECINPDHIFDPSKGACFPSISSTTRHPTSIVKMFLTASAGDKIIVEEDLPETPSQEKDINAILLLVLVLIIALVQFIGIAFVISRRLKRGIRSRPVQEVSAHSTVTATIDMPDSTCGSSRVDVEIGLSQGLTVTTSDQERLMKLRRDEKSMHKEEDNLNRRGCGDEVTNGAVSVLRGTSPYWLVMMGYFGPEGGVLSCQDSDVVLEIPPGAIPASHPHQFIKAKVSLSPDAVAPELMNDQDFLSLTPVVEFESPGLNKFSRDVLIRLPHKACKTYDPSWTFRTHFTDPTPATHKNPTPATKNQVPLVNFFSSKGPLCDPWYFVDMKNHISECKSGKGNQRRSKSSRGVAFTVDEKYFNISTPHFSKYSCSGCHKNHPLHFETVVYAGHLKGRGYEEVTLAIYIMDPIKDCRRVVEQEQREANPPRTRVSDYHRVILDYNKKYKDNRYLEVTLMPDGMVNDWQWKLQYENHQKAQQFIKYQDLIRCCSSLGPFLHTYDLEPKTTHREEPFSIFKAMIYFRQHQQEKGSQREPLKVVITLPLSDQCYGRKLGHTRNKGYLESTVVTEDHIDLVLTKLLPKDWRRLFRKLMGTDVENEIQGIVARNPNDAHEQKHDALLSWTRSRGRNATVDVLISALRSLDLTDIADSLEGIKYPLKETPL